MQAASTGGLVEAAVRNVWWLDLVCCLPFGAVAFATSAAFRPPGRSSGTISIIPDAPNYVPGPGWPSRRMLWVSSELGVLWPLRVSRSRRGQRGDRPGMLGGDATVRRFGCPCLRCSSDSRLVCCGHPMFHPETAAVYDRVSVAVCLRPPLD